MGSLESNAEEGTVQPLLILGAGGLGRETAEAVDAINTLSATWRLLGFLDDAESRQGSSALGLPVLGTLDSVHEYGDVSVVVCVGRSGDTTTKARVVERLDLSRDRYASVVHPTARLGRSVEVGCGAILLAGVTATASVRISDHVVCMPNVVLTHDDHVKEFGTLGAGATLAGGVTIGRGAYVGSGALVREGRAVGDGAVVGMGAVVIDDVPAGEVWAGVPAARLRSTGGPSGDG